jgi:hypothetical protein
MFKLLTKIKTIILILIVSVSHSNVFAALPKPPDKLDIKDGNYASALISYGLTIMGYGCYLLAGLASLSRSKTFRKD